MDILAWSASARVVPTVTPIYRKHRWVHALSSSRSPPYSSETRSITSDRSQNSAYSDGSNSTCAGSGSHFSADSSPATSMLDLSRTSSHTSHASSLAKYTPVLTPKKSRHLRAFSDSTRRLQKKSQEAPNRRSEPIMAPVVPERIADTVVSDLLIRCRDDDYHVDRSIMCHHAQFFAKVYSKINYPVRIHQHVLTIQPC
jgi:hypothetical protein